MAFYDKVKEIWYEHLTKALQQFATAQKDANNETADTEGQNEAIPYATPLQFGEENLQDAAKMLRGIVGLQTERFGREHHATARAEHVLGLFMLWNGDTVSAVHSLLKALEISKRLFGERHQVVGEIRSTMLHFGLQIPDDTTNVLQEQDEPPQNAAESAPAAAEAEAEPEPNTDGSAAPPSSTQETNVTQ